LGDVLDVKASVALVAVTFLAGVSAQLIAMQGLSSLWGKIQLLGQTLALLSLAIAGALIIAELWPSDYVSPPTPKEDADWIEKLLADRGDHTAVLDAVLEQKLSSAINRVEKNKRTNDRKSGLINLTFKLLSVAIVLILGNLLYLAVKAAWPVLTSLAKCG
jgi:hypothetical protein